MKDHELIHAAIERDSERMKDEHVLSAWEQECPTVPPITIELAKIEGTLKGVATCLRDQASVLIPLVGDDLRFYAQEVQLMAERLTKVREQLY